MSRILSKEFRYVPAAKTDIRKLFARVRKDMAEKQQAEKAKVQPLKVARG